MDNYFKKSLNIGIIFIYWSTEEIHEALVNNNSVVRSLLELGTVVAESITIAITFIKNLRRLKIMLH